MKFKVFVRNDSCEWIDIGIVEATNPKECVFKTITERHTYAAKDDVWIGKGWPNAEFYFQNENDLKNWIDANLLSSTTTKTISAYIPFNVSYYYFDNKNSAIIVVIEVDQYKEWLVNEMRAIE